MPAESYLVDTAAISFGRISAETYENLGVYAAFVG